MATVLILHATLGSGHVTAANAIRDAFAERGLHDVVTADVFDFGNKLFKRLVTKTYARLSEQAPMLWKTVYDSTDLTDMKQVTAANRLRVESEKRFVTKLDDFVRANAPEIVIGTHFVPAEVLLSERRAGKIGQPIYEVITDYMAHSNWIHEGMDGYFVANDLTQASMAAMGVPRDTIHVTGIPVSPTLAEPKAMAEARARHDLAPDEQVVTLFGAALAPTKVRTIVSQLLASDIRGTLYVAAGRSADLLQALEDLGDGNTLRLRKLGFVNYVDDLIVASDLVISKAGGLITSEVLARGTPMVVFDPIPGQEEWNADYVVGEGAGVQVRITNMVAPAVLAILRDRERLAVLRQDATRIGRPRAALDIADYILSRLG
ncbi:MAG: hypothetical protein U0822_12365 [Anaerolineae bacterium]